MDPEHESPSDLKPQKITRRAFLGIVATASVGMVLAAQIWNRFFSRWGFLDEGNYTQFLPPDFSTGPFMDSEKSTVALVKCEDREEGIKKVLSLLGGISIIDVNEIPTHILVKPNLNTPDPFPASTHSETLRVVLEELVATGVPEDKIIVGDLPNSRAIPTRNSFEKKGYTKIIDDLGVTAYYPDEDSNAWVKVISDKATSWGGEFRLARVAVEASRVVSLPALKTHAWATFTLSMKNSVGLLHLDDRGTLHLPWASLRSKVAELCLGYRTDLVILDGMKCFVIGGPTKGVEKSPGVIIGGSDRLAIDIVGTTILKFYDAAGIAYTDVIKQTQIARAKELGIGKSSKDEIDLTTADLTTSESDFSDLLDFLDEHLPS